VLHLKIGFNVELPSQIAQPQTYFWYRKMKCSAKNIVCIFKELGNIACSLADELADRNAIY
jgi:hypothetical protein